MITACEQTVQGLGANVGRINVDQGQGKVAALVMRHRCAA
jgi:hypothetical protein